MKQNENLINGKKFRESIDSLNVNYLNQQIRGIQQKDIIQSIFKFSDPEEVLANFNYVCKSWKCALDGLKFLEHNDFITIDDFRFESIVLKNISKFESIALQFDYRDLDPREEEKYFSYILNNVRNIKALNFILDVDTWDEEPEEQIFILKIKSFFHSLLENIKHSMKAISVKGIIPSISLPNVQIIDILEMESERELEEIDELFAIISEFTKLTCIQFDTNGNGCSDELHHILTENQLITKCAMSNNISDLEIFPIRILQLIPEFEINFKNYQNYENIEYISFSTSIMETNILVSIKEIGLPWVTSLPNLKGVIYINDEDNCIVHENNLNEHVKKYPVIYDPIQVKKCWLHKFKILKENDIEILTIFEFEERISKFIKNDWKIRFY